MTETRIAPCPWCEMGAEVMHTAGSLPWLVWCETCCVSGPASPTRQTAKQNWNWLATLQQRVEEAEDALAAIDKAEKKLESLCNGKEQWRMSVPAQPDSDPDLVIAEALHLARQALIQTTPEDHSESEEGE